MAYRDVENDRAAMAEMVKASNGRRDVPVILEAGKVTIGYGGS
ncbi:MAG: Glutaredoxin family protein [Actinobacteria bacterium]|nr:Glutaredoxin family protein [Actinomycetota bacterium]